MLAEQKPDRPNQLCSDAEAKMLRHLETIDAHVSKLEALTLYRQALVLERGSRILEIGSFKGASTVAIAHAALQKEHVIYCIDPWTDYEQQLDFINNPAFDMSKRDEVLFEFRRNTTFAGRTVRAMQGYSEDFSEMLPTAFFDMIFIDGAHDYQSVCSDILVALRCLKPSGLLLGHDYHSMGNGVVRAVNEFIFKVPSISTKGLFAETSIWYSTIPNPEYELKMHLLVTQISSSSHHAINTLHEMLQQYGPLEELLSLKLMIVGKGRE